MVSDQQVRRLFMLIQQNETLSMRRAIWQLWRLISWVEQSQTK